MGLKRRNPARIRLFTTPEKTEARVPPAAVERRPAPVAAPAEPAVAAPPPPPPRRISSEERHALIAKIAYGIAERAHFKNDPLANWLAAEREVDASISAPVS